MDNPENLSTYGTQEEDKQSENTTQYVLYTTTRKQTQIKHEPSYKQLEVKMNWTSFYEEIAMDITTRNSERM
jgi:hypothetical protein